MTRWPLSSVWMKPFFSSPQAPLLPGGTNNGKSDLVDADEMILVEESLAVAALKQLQATGGDADNFFRCEPTKTSGRRIVEDIALDDDGADHSFGGRAGVASVRAGQAIGVHVVNACAEIAVKPFAADGDGADAGVGIL